MRSCCPLAQPPNCVLPPCKLSETAYLIYSDVPPILWAGIAQSVERLRDRRSADRIPVGATFSAPAQTGPEAHPASSTMGTGPFSRGVKQLGRGVDHLPQSSAEVKERVELYLYSPSQPSWPVVTWTLCLCLYPSHLEAVCSIHILGNFKLLTAHDSSFSHRGYVISCYVVYYTKVTCDHSAPYYGLKSYLRRLQFWLMTV